MYHGKGRDAVELERLIRSVDIVDFISQYVALTPKNGEFWGLSPFKKEKTPSFSVRRETGQFYDFSSGIGGNVFTFVKAVERCSSGEAVEILKKYAGVSGEEDVSEAKYGATEVCRRFSRPEKPQKAVRHTVFPENCMERYEKSEEHLAVWKKEGISDATLAKFQVAYDRFSNRLVYPIRDAEGNIVNIGGRTLCGDWRERGLRKYTYYAKWGELDVLYGLYENREAIRSRGEVLLFEGAKSVLKCDTWGIGNAAALLTSHLNPRQMRLLAGLGVRAVFALDKDADPRSDQNIQKLRRFVPVFLITDTAGLLSEKDSPADKGKEVFVKLYRERKPFRQ